MLTQSQSIANNDFTIGEQAIVENLRCGGKSAQSDFFNERIPDLERLARLRMSGLLRRRLDASDIVQLAYIEFAKRVEGYLNNPTIPPVPWLRKIVRQVVAHQNRFHLSAKCRDLRREKYDGTSSEVNIEVLADSISSISSPLKRKETRERILQLINSMGPCDREIITLVHIEGLSLREASIELDIKIEAAKKRYHRAINKFRVIFEGRIANLHQSK